MRFLYENDLNLEEFEIKDNYLIKFNNIYGKTDVTIPDGVLCIGEEAFAWCYDLKSVTIPNSVTDICDFAFYGCQGLTDIEIPNSVKYIGEKAFSLCYNLTSITIPAYVYIGWRAFVSCYNLKDVYFLGSEHDLNFTNISDGNENFLNANIHFNSKYKKLKKT